MSARAAKRDRQQLRDTLELARAQVQSLQDQLAYERLQRVSAQRGLVAYMKEHGLADQIGYDPDHDPSLALDNA